MDDVRDEGTRIAVRAQPGPGLVPDEIALGHEPDGRRAPGEVRAGEDVAPVLVCVAHDDHRVAARPQDPLDLAEDALHLVEEGRIVRRVGEVVG